MQVIRRTTLQSNGDRAGSTRPSNLERLAGFNIAEVAVGEGNIGAGQAGEDERRDDELHFSRFCWVSTCVKESEE